LSFHEENIPAFLENFETIKERIRSAGNRLLELYQDKNNKSIFFYLQLLGTERFRELPNFQFFNEVWSFTKNYSTINPKLERR
jgi:hypothetical protein